MGRDETRAPLKSPAWEARSWLLLMVFKCWCACGYQLRYTIELNESMNNAQTITKYLPKNDVNVAFNQVLFLFKLSIKRNSLASC